MPDVNAWLGNSFPKGNWTDDIDRARDTARLISEKATSITVYRNGASLNAQTVRIEAWSDYAQRQASDAGVTSKLQLLVIGYKDHPTTDDTDLQVGDRFEVESVLVEVMMVLPGYVGRLMAVAEAVA